jgi:RimJ/RimL family protein N-acetyltransferase
MPGAAFLRGERVSLHPIEEADLEFLQAHRNAQAIRQPLTDSHPRNAAQMAESFESDGNGDGIRLLICIGDEDAVRTGDEEALTRVGEVGVPWVRQPHGTGMLMYWVAPEHQGNGYVTEATELVLDHAFRDMRLHRVWAMVIETNPASQRVLEKAGFQREGVDRQGTFIDGEYVDNHRFGLLAADWFADE